MRNGYHDLVFYTFDAMSAYVVVATLPKFMTYKLYAVRSAEHPVVATSEFQKPAKHKKNTAKQ